MTKPTTLERFRNAMIISEDVRPGTPKFHAHVPGTVGATDSPSVEVRPQQRAEKTLAESTQPFHI